MNKKVRKIMDYYEKLNDSEESWVKWSEKRKRFSEGDANSFFIGVMLDQGQLAERAWDGAVHLVENYFQGDNFWENIARTHHSKVKHICQKGYEGKSYAISFKYNQFPNWLRSASQRMISVYDGDPRNIWNVSSEKVDDIYTRFLSFDGIGDALAKMAQFLLVRDYGVAGGVLSKPYMSVKPDIHVRRVLSRLGISPSIKISDIKMSIDNLNLLSPADFDAAIWEIGRNYCFKNEPKCDYCPVSTVCENL